MEITKITSSLLLEHNCVILPGFGGFVGNFQSAQLNNLTHKISPPRKKITFNSNLKTNDGLLINALSQKLGITYQEAEKQIQQEINVLKSEISSGKSFEIPEVGVLFEDLQKRLRFEPNLQSNLLKDSFGLTPIFALIKPIEETIEPKVNQSIEQKIKPISASLPKSKTGFSFGKIAATLLAIISFGYLFWLFSNTEITNSNRAFQMGDLNPFTEKKCMKYQVKNHLALPLGFESLNDLEPLVIPDSVSHTTFNLYLEEEKSENIKAKIVRLLNYQIQKPDSLKVKTVEPGNPDFKYYIVIGCFSVQENAEKLVAKLRKNGYDAGIIDLWKGLYRVHIARFSHKVDALDALEVIKTKENPGAWVLNK